MDSISLLRLCGIAGLLGSALLLAADWVMLGTFTSGREFTQNWYILLAEMPVWRLRAGGLAGPVGAWLYVVAFWQLFVALRPAGKLLAFITFAGFSMSFVWVAGALHTSFPFLAHAWRAREASMGEGAVVVQWMSERAFGYAWLLYFAAMVPAFVGCVLLAYAVLLKRTRYPRWFVLLNPALLFLVARSFQRVPAPLGGLLVIGAGNLVFLVFFAVSTRLLWDGGKQDELKAESA
jgi:hypothetical protein